MAIPGFEVPSGAIDGVNKDFILSVNYAPGSLQVWRNGILSIATDDDGWIETGSNTFQTKIAPLVDDKLKVFRVPL